MILVLHLFFLTTTIDVYGKDVGTLAHVFQTLLGIFKSIA